MWTFSNISLSKRSSRGCEVRKKNWTILRLPWRSHYLVFLLYTFFGRQNVLNTLTKNLSKTQYGNIWPNKCLNRISIHLASPQQFILRNICPRVNFIVKNDASPVIPCVTFIDFCANLSKNIVHFTQTHTHILPILEWAPNIYKSKTLMVFQKWW